MKKPNVASNPIRKIRAVVCINSRDERVNNSILLPLRKGIVNFKDYDAPFDTFDDLQIKKIKGDEVMIFYNGVNRIISRETKATFSKMITFVDTDNSVTYGVKVITFFCV